MKASIVPVVATLLVLPQLATAGTIPPAVGTNTASASGWVGGAQAGYNWQSGSMVYGFEADIAGTGLKKTMNTTLQDAFTPPSTASTTSGIDWYGTVRGRLGWTTGPLMFYGTAGLAYGQINVNSTVTDHIITTSVNSQSSSGKTGWVAGFGLDYLLRPNLIANFGYQYVDLGRTNLFGSVPEGDFALSQIVGVRHQFQVVSVGLSWLFPAPGPVAPDRPRYAKAPVAPVAFDPWAGFYAGGHVGGAWGDRTTGDYLDSAIFGSDIRFKRDITLVGRRDDGLGIYRYRYLWSDNVYVGAMAQEVALIHPDAVVRDPLTGYLAVDYARLGLRSATREQ